jgi:hypothetical protein
MQHDVLDRGSEIKKQMVLKGNADVRDWLRDWFIADNDIACRAIQQSGNHKH